MYTVTTLRRSVYTVRSVYIAHLPETVFEIGQSVGRKYQIGPRARTDRLEARRNVTAAVRHVRYADVQSEFRRLHQTAPVLGHVGGHGQRQICEFRTRRDGWISNMDRT